MRLIGGMLFYRYFTYNALEQTMNAVHISHDIDVILSLNESLRGKHGKLVIHSLKDQVEIREV